MALQTDTPAAALHATWGVATALGASTVVFSSGAKTLYGIEIDHTANPDEDGYLMLADATSATVGTTKPEMKIPFARGKVFRAISTTGIGFATGITAWVVNSNADAADVAPFPVPVVVRLLY